MQISKESYLRQERIEKTFGKRFIHEKAVKDLKSEPSIYLRMLEAVPVLEQWIHSDEHWESKAKRLQQIADLDLEQLVQDIMAMVALHCIKPMKLVSIASMAAKFLNMSGKIDAIHTMAEVMAVLADIDILDINTDRHGTRWVISRYLLDDEVMRYAFHAMYLPPMLIRPKKLRSNRDSGYITQKGESLILGFYENHHDGDICLDVLNTQNANEYELDTDFIGSHTESWHREELTPEQYAELSHEDRLIYEMDKNTWDEFTQQGYKIKTLMLYHGNSFYLQNRVDKRGRVYTSGYHISPQGSSFKKACINLKKKEICTGVKEWQD